MVEHPRVHADFVACADGGILLDHRLERVERRGGCEAGIAPGTDGAAPGVVDRAAVVQINDLGAGALNLEHRVVRIRDRRLPHAGHADQVTNARRQCRNIPAIESVGAVQRAGARRRGPTAAGVRRVLDRHHVVGGPRPRGRPAHDSPAEKNLPAVRREQPQHALAAGRVGLRRAAKIAQVDAAAVGERLRREVRGRIAGVERGAVGGEMEVVVRAKVSAQLIVGTVRINEQRIEINRVPFHAGVILQRRQRVARAFPVPHHRVVGNEIIVVVRQPTRPHGVKLDAGLRRTGGRKNVVRHANVIVCAGQTKVHRRVPIERVVLDRGLRRVEQSQPRARVQINQVPRADDGAAFRVDAEPVVGINAVAAQRQRRGVIAPHAAGVLVNGVVHH